MCAMLPLSQKIITKVYYHSPLQMVKVCTGKSETSEEFPTTNLHATTTTAQADEVCVLKNRIVELEDMLQKAKEE